MTTLGLGLGTRRGAKRKSSPTARLKWVVSNSRLPNSRINLASMDGFASRTPQFVCEDTGTMVVLLPNWFLNATAGVNNAGAIWDTGNNLKVAEAS